MESAVLTASNFRPHELQRCVGRFEPRPPLSAVWKSLLSSGWTVEINCEFLWGDGVLRTGVDAACAGVALQRSMRKGGGRPDFTEPELGDPTSGPALRNPL
jgi:hypothetical protein